MAFTHKDLTYQVGAGNKLFNVGTPSKSNGFPFIVYVNGNEYGDCITEVSPYSFEFDEAPHDEDTVEVLYQDSTITNEININQPGFLAEDLLTELREFLLVYGSLVTDNRIKANIRDINKLGPNLRKLIALERNLPSAFTLAGRLICGDDGKKGGIDGEYFSS